MTTQTDVDALYKRADEAFKKHNYDYARDLLLQILMLDPNHAQGRRALKGAVIKKFQEQGATSKIKMMAVKGQFDIQLKTNKDAAKRVELCQKFLCQDPTNAKVRTVLAESLFALGHWAGAGAEADMASVDDPSHVPAAKVLVMALTKTGNVKEAQTILERISSLVKEDRDLEHLQRDLAAMQTMSKGFEGGSGAKDDFRKALKNSDQAEELEKRSKLVQTDADFQKLVAELQTELAANPTEAKIAKKLGDLYFEKKKDYPKAKEWYQKACQLAPQDSVLRDKVDDCDLRAWAVKVDAAQKAADPKLNEIKLGQLKATIASFERRVQDRPTDMALRFELGKAYYIGSMVDKAIGEFQQAVKDPKKKSEGHFYLGRAFQKKKMFDMAEKQYIASEDGVLSQDRKLEILYFRAVCCAEAGRIPQAVELGNKIVEVDINFKDISALVEKWSGQ